MGSNNGSSNGYAHKFHETTIRTILERARRYRHCPRRLDVGNGPFWTKGDEIREPIADNARKRFEIAEAMKREAGVVDHHLTGEGDGGIAWSNRAAILAPVGENRVQLATLAHECGHIFLHSAGSPGYNLPGHVKELEAESYAHQAFLAHGMRMPAKVTAWGRAYVGEWVANDRAAGIPIDPRAEAYADGTRSPYAPLRLVPATWGGASEPAERRVVEEPPLQINARKLPPPRDTVLQRLVRDVRSRWARLRERWSSPPDRAPRYVWQVRREERRLRARSPLSWWREGLDLMKSATSHTYHVWLLTMIVIYQGRTFFGLPPEWSPEPGRGPSIAHFANGLALALVWACLAMLIKTMTRMPRPTK